MLNGTSSVGKSTLANALRPLLPATFCYYSSDQLADAGFRSLDPDERWNQRDAFFDGFHRSIAAFAAAGLDLLIEHIVEQPAWAEQLDELLRPFDVFRVGVHAPLKLIEERERQRGDRAPGEAREHVATHEYWHYDLEIENVGPPLAVAETVARAWTRRNRELSE